MEYYNLSGMLSANNTLALAQSTNTILGGFYFGWITLIILAFVTFVSLKAKGYVNAACFSVTCWFLMIISWLLRTMSLIDNYTLWGIVILTIISVPILFLSGN